VHLSKGREPSSLCRMISGAGRRLLCCRDTAAQMNPSQPPPLGLSNVSPACAPLRGCATSTLRAYSLCELQLGGNDASA
jgi:hypothetical protein